MPRPTAPAPCAGTPPDAGGRGIGSAAAGRRARRIGSLHRVGDAGAARPAAARRPLGVRARSRRHHPVRIRAAASRIWASRSTPRSKPRSRSICAALQGAHGGWPLFHAGDFDMSASVKAYFALKMIGDAPDADHMRRAREAILQRGGAARSQRVHAAPAGAVRRHPVARGSGDAGRDHAAAALVPVPPRQDFVLEPHRHRAAAGAAGDEGARAQRQGRAHRRAVRRAAAAASARCRRRRSRRPRGSGSSAASTICCARSSRCFPGTLRRRAIDRAVAWVGERLNGEDGLGAIYPAMANSVMMFDVLGYPARSSAACDRARARSKSFWSSRTDEAYCQPCVSPIWDTGLVCHALLETGDAEAVRRVQRGLEWLTPKQVLDVRGDWIARRPDVRPGGWAFQYANPHYPDVDDTAVVVMAMDARAGRRRTARVRSRHRARARVDHRPAEPQRRAGARSMPTTSITTSTTFRSPTTARCSIRRPRTSPPAACRCWRRSAICPSIHRHALRRSTISGARSAPTAAGTAAGA